MNKDSKCWVQLTKRTNDPKLKWLEITLARAGIQSRRNGESWHAPILQVQAKDLDAAWKILTPIDDVPDDDPRWLQPFDNVDSFRRDVAEWLSGASCVNPCVSNMTCYGVPHEVAIRIIDEERVRINTRRNRGK